MKIKMCKFSIVLLSAKNYLLIEVLNYSVIR